jgi:stearoyl-CoA desaturase (delta-9 desaturase)
MLLGWGICGTIWFSWSAVLVFVVASAVMLCLGHSLGMHRKLIHEAFDCPLWLERCFVYLGTLVGLGGPFGMMVMHDMRDWAQRQTVCHPFLSHQSGFLRDFWWQLHCKLHLNAPPEYRLPARITRDRFYRFVEWSWMAQQVPLAIVLFALGGIGWVAWGICGRVTVSIFGHWLIGYFAHNDGHRDWHIRGAAVQGYNVRGFGLLTFGECWHNNHHAFPSSARLGHAGQMDPGWWVLIALKRIGLVQNLNQPDDLPQRQELEPLNRGSFQTKPVDRVLLRSDT